MIAVVLSGGGNRGALHAGAAQALIEHGIIPDLVVSTSVGSTVGSALAVRPDSEGVQCAIQGWRRVRREDVFPGNPLTAGWRLLRGQGGLHDPTPFRRFMLSFFPPGVRHFGDTAIPFLVTTTTLRGCRLRLFGRDAHERLIDGLMATCAIPPFYPPYRLNDEVLVDGAIIANLPLGIALGEGARTIFALDIHNNMSDMVVNASNLGHTLFYSFMAMMNHQIERERQLAALARQHGVEVHHICLEGGHGLRYDDFGHTDALIESGYATVKQYLSSIPAVQSKRTVRRRLIASLRHALAVRNPQTQSS